jgi:hypothetical protein
MLARKIRWRGGACSGFFTIFGKHWPVVTRSLLWGRSSEHGFGVKKKRRLNPEGMYGAWFRTHARDERFEFMKLLIKRVVYDDENVAWKAFEGPFCRNWT